MPAYGGFPLKALEDYFLGQSIKAMLADASYVQDVDAHFYLADLPAGSEIPPGGTYTAGGVAVANLSVTYDQAASVVRVGCDDVTFGAGAEVEVGGVLFYIATGDRSTSRLLAYDAFTPPTLDGTPLTYEVGDGFLTIPV